MTFPDPTSPHLLHCNSLNPGFSCGHLYYLINWKKAMQLVCIKSRHIVIFLMLNSGSSRPGENRCWRVRLRGGTIVASCYCPPARKGCGGGSGSCSQCPAWQVTCHHQSHLLVQPTMKIYLFLILREGLKKNNMFFIHILWISVLPPLIHISTFYNNIIIN